MMLAVRPDLVAMDRVGMAKANSTPDVADVVGGGVYRWRTDRRALLVRRDRQPRGSDRRRRANGCSTVIASALAEKLCNAELWELPWQAEQSSLARTRKVQEH